MKSKILFYLLSWTWGLPMTFIGYLTALAMIAIGKCPYEHGGSYMFTIGRGWGGLSLGPITLIHESPSEYLKDHEFGHAIQNCYYGPLFLFIVAIPSMIRYLYREALVVLKTKTREELSDYFSIWFEKQASDLGKRYVRYWK